MSLLNLAPDIQEAILFLPKTMRGRDVIALAVEVDGERQRAGNLEIFSIPDEVGSK